jgi:hypothetical protein
MKNVILVLALAGILALAVFGAHRAWSALEDVAISTNGLIALGLGITITLALGVGLMFLVFYSSRHGYDDNDRPSDPRSGA